MFDVKNMGTKEFQIWQNSQAFAELEDGFIEFDCKDIENSLIIPIDEMFAMPSEAVWTEQLL